MDTKIVITWSDGRQEPLICEKWTISDGVLTVVSADATRIFPLFRHVAMIALPRDAD